MLQNSVVEDKPKIKYSQYLAHEKEPKVFGASRFSPEVEAELIANRFFLKRRVWKNMEKIRRSMVPEEHPHPARHKRAYRPHQLTI